MRLAGAFLSIAFLAACASEPRPTAVGSARYASPDEAARLHAQAAANFQRERERQGMVADRRSDPASQRRVMAAPVTVRASTLPPIMEGPPPRRRVSAAEARYAMQIGKSPFELTAGERAVAAGY